MIHGVMKTDNMSVAGETIDYGPCAFMDAYHPGTVYSSIDRGGLYAYGKEPRIAQWNLSRLAQTLLPIIDEHQDKAVEEAQAAIDAFPERFEQAYLERFRTKLGLLEAHPDDADLIDYGQKHPNRSRRAGVPDGAMRISETSRHREGLSDLAIELAAHAAGFRRSLPEGVLIALERRRSAR